jgi:hypothetical protein
MPIITGQQMPILQAAELRGQGRLQEAINLIEANLNQLDRDKLVPALLEAFRAAVELNNPGKAMVFAMAIASEDREIPSIQAYLP